LEAGLKLNNLLVTFLERILNKGEVEEGEERQFLRFHQEGYWETLFGIFSSYF